MSYDLHGVWDQTNPIGSIAQAHTNLTEIKLAAELLWRVEVKPSQVAIGFGFYGRAFTLQDPSCTDPGCPFSAGADPGICTRTSGYLAYYEIQDILSKEKNTKSLLNNGDIKIAHDKTAAVKYFTWNNDQWISYDDADTFKQKIDWANSIGFSGSLIWASDLDDYSFTAHKAITGKTNIESALTIKDSQEQLNPDPDTVSSDLNGSLAKDCYKFPDIVALDNPQVSTCRSGYTTVGYDRATSAGKDGEWGRPWCCPKNSGLKNCQWRGSGGDCNGQCHPGEIHLDGSSWGGKPGESGTGKCSRGGKALCCQMEQFEAFTDGCYWTDGANKPCNDLDMKLAYAWDKRGRKKSLCCKPNLDEFTTFTCETTEDPCGDDDSDDCRESYDDYEASNSATKRSHEAVQIKSMRSDDVSMRIEGRGFIRSFSLTLRQGAFWSKKLSLKIRDYAGGVGLFTGLGSESLPQTVHGAWSMAQDLCTTTTVKLTALSDIAKTGNHADHLQEAQMIPRLLKTAVTGILPSGATLKAAKLDPVKVYAAWNKEYDVSLPLIGPDLTGTINNWARPLTPNDRIFEVIGSYAYRKGMALLEGEMNRIKGNIFRNYRPIGKETMNTLLTTVKEGNALEAQAAAQEIARKLQKVIGVFNYMNDNVLRTYLDLARKDLKKEIGYVNNYVPGFKGISDIWEEFEPDYYAHAAKFAIKFLNTAATEIIGTFPNGAPANNLAASMLIHTVTQILKHSSQIKFDARDVE
ncbi:putative chitinase [Microsporum audouinii]